MTVGRSVVKDGQLWVKGYFIFGSLHCWEKYVPLLILPPACVAGFVENGPFFFFSPPTQIVKMKFIAKVRRLLNTCSVMFIRAHLLLANSVEIMLNGACFIRR